MASFARVRSHVFAGARAMLYISLTVSAILLVSVNWSAWRAERPLGPILAKAIAIGLASTGVCLFMLLPVILQAALVCVVALIWRTYRWPPRSFLALSCAATVIAFAIPGYFAFRSTRHLQEAYPYISMDDRFPLPKRQPSFGVMPVGTANRLAEMESRIDDEEKKWPTSYRTTVLRQLHEEAVQIFVNQQGFGVTRASGLREHLMKQGIRQEQPIPQPGASSASPWLTEQLRKEPSSFWLIDKYSLSLLSLHRESVVDFVNLPGFGYFKDRKHITGFQEHQVSQLPTPQEPWMLQRLDLIGLVVHETPTAYVSDYLPRMQELRVAPTRRLDEFESAGLLALQHGEELFIREREQERRMLGAIRAARQCLACHETERGELLGVFSYRMTPKDK